MSKEILRPTKLAEQFDPSAGTQVSKVWWDGEKLMATPIALEDFYQPAQDSTCSETLRTQGKAYPRTCKKCGRGPCIADPVQPAPSIWTPSHWTEYERDIRNATLDEIAAKIAAMPFGDTAASFAVWIKEQKT